MPIPFGPTGSPNSPEYKGVRPSDERFSPRYTPKKQMHHHAKMIIGRRLLRPAPADAPNPPMPPRLTPIPERMPPEILGPPPKKFTNREELFQFEAQNFAQRPMDASEKSSPRGDRIMVSVPSENSRLVKSDGDCGPHVEEGSLT